MNIKVIDKKKQREQYLTDAKRASRAVDRLVRGLLILAGTLFVVLGILGIFIPLLPTTPFLLLAAACYAKSSKRFYNWLLSNRWFGNYIKNYREKKGVPSRVKIGALSLLWVTILASGLLATDNLLVRVILILIAVGVTVHILSIRTLRE